MIARSLFFTTQPELEKIGYRLSLQGVNYYFIKRHLCHAKVVLGVLKARQQSRKRINGSSRVLKRVFKCGKPYQSKTT